MVVNIASDELSKLKHNGPGLPTMPIVAHDSVGSQLIITFATNHSLDRFCFFFFYIPVSICLMLFTLMVIVLAVLRLLCTSINYWQFLLSFD
jgi:cyclophilin family peptidyl-prolyl cis-trans isomerase